MENKYGVVARISGLFMRKGFNIDSFTGRETHDPRYSRITITLNGDDYTREQLVGQLRKLHNVKQVKLLDSGGTVERELMLIKVRNTPENRGEIMAASEIYRAKIVNYTTDSLCVEVTGEPSKLNAFIEVMRPLGIVEMCRTGVIALERNESLEPHEQP